MNALKLPLDTYYTYADLLNIEGDERYELFEGIINVIIPLKNLEAN